MPFPLSLRERPTVGLSLRERRRCQASGFIPKPTGRARGLFYSILRMPSPAVLLIQLGTPDATTTPALRKYLSQFLGDPRVIEAPRLAWWFILHGYILRTRPRQSAAKYRRIWHPEKGSPLLYITQQQTSALQKVLPNVPVRFGMQVGNPSVASVVSELIREGVDRLIVLPMYPQYSAATTASAMDVLF